jgi:hypothetical protein
VKEKAMALLHQPVLHFPSGWTRGDWRWGTASKVALGTVLAAALLAGVVANVQLEVPFTEAVPTALASSPLGMATYLAPEKDPYEQAKRLAVEVELPAQF